MIRAGNPEAGHSMEPTDLDLTICDSESIHAPGAIQPHGVLLVLAEPDLRILQASASLRAQVGLNAANMLGQPLALLLDGPSHEAVLRSLGQDLAGPHYLPPLATSTGSQFEALIHRTEAGLILELEPYAGAATLDVARVIRDTMAEAHQAPTLATACQAAAERLRALTGFDRVMVYRFRPDDSGSVIAEARNDILPPYLGLTYPASDIPRQARELALLSPLRVRKGNEVTASPLVPALSPRTGAPLDMSRCALRATSPIHLEYLRNMGVSASLTLSIVQDGRLWGMFACHHAEARYVPHAQRLACEALGHLLAMQIEAKQQADETADRLRKQEWLLRALHTAAGSASLAEAFERLGPALPEVVGADGVAIRAGGRTMTFGSTPEHAHIAGLTAWLGRERPARLFETSALSREFPAAAAYADRGSGILALPLAAEAGDWVVWCRAELIRTVSWAGDPHKPVLGNTDGERISPRKSFAAWAETVRGQSEAWSAAETGMVQTLHQALRDIALPNYVGRSTRTKE